MSDIKKAILDIASQSNNSTQKSLFKKLKNGEELNVYEQKLYDKMNEGGILDQIVESKASKITARKYQNRNKFSKYELSEIEKQINAQLTKSSEEIVDNFIAIVDNKIYIIDGNNESFGIYKYKSFDNNEIAKKVRGNINNAISRDGGLYLKKYKSNGSLGDNGSIGQVSLSEDVQDNKKQSRYFTKGIGGETKYSRGLAELDNEGNKLTQEQADYFKNSKVKDKDGRLILTAHFTGENFTSFDKTKYGKGAGQVHGNDICLFLYKNLFRFFPI